MTVFFELEYTDAERQVKNMQILHISFYCMDLRGL